MTSFLSLPAEIHQHIQNECSFPASMSLKLTCRLLHGRLPDVVISPEHLAEEDTSIFAKERDLWACYDCLRLRPAKEFLDKHRKGKTGRNGTSPMKRCCVECGVKMEPGSHQLPRISEVFAIYKKMGEKYRLCFQCNEFVPIGETDVQSHKRWHRHLCEVCKGHLWSRT